MFYFSTTSSAEDVTTTTTKFLPILKRPNVNTDKDGRDTMTTSVTRLAAASRTEDMDMCVKGVSKFCLYVRADDDEDEGNDDDEDDGHFVLVSG